MALSSVQNALLLAAYYRGGRHRDGRWISNCDQVVTLSLFYTNDISVAECASRFSQRSCVGNLYNAEGELTEPIKTRYRALIDLIRESADLIEGGGDLETPEDPTFTACRLTDAGLELACVLNQSFPQKPDFPNWPDKRGMPD
jgi:hypothetical protein